MIVEGAGRFFEEEAAIVDTGVITGVGITEVSKAGLTFLTVSEAGIVFWGVFEGSSTFLAACRGGAGFGRESTKRLLLLSLLKCVPKLANMLFVFGSAFASVGATAEG